MNQKNGHFSNLCSTLSLKLSFLKTYSTNGVKQGITQKRDNRQYNNKTLTDGIKT